MFGLSRQKRAQNFAVTISISSLQADQVIAVPYPILHQQQQVSDLSWDSDGHIVDQGGYTIVTQATWVKLTANIHTEPFCLKSFSQLDTANARILQTMQTCYDQTLQRLTYGNPIPGLYTAKQAMELVAVDCGGFSSYLITLLQDAKITARLVAGFWAGYHDNGMHAWAEAALPDDTWLPLDASTDWLHQRGRTKKIGGFGVLGSDRVVISVDDDHVIQLDDQSYNVGMLQWPMLLLPNGKFSYLDQVTTVRTKRL